MSQWVRVHLQQLCKGRRKSPDLKTAPCWNCTGRRYGAQTIAIVRWRSATTPEERRIQASDLYTTHDRNEQITAIIQWKHDDL
jgi:hypothetical protein